MQRQISLNLSACHPPVGQEFPQNLKVFSLKLRYNEEYSISVIVIGE